MRFLYFMSCLCLLAVSMAKYFHHKSDPHISQPVYVNVSETSFSEAIFFQGVIQPLSVTDVVSPMDGVIKNIYFHAGQVVRQGDVLFELQSSQLNQVFQASAIQYAKAWRDDEENRRQADIAKHLHRLQYISADEYREKQHAKVDSDIVLFQSREKLAQVLNLLGVKEDVENYRGEYVWRIFSKRRDKVLIRAEKSGILLAPLLDTESQHLDNAFTQGFHVKTEEALASIGDFKGLRVMLTVSEMDIQNIKMGFVAKITGPAFPNITLMGHVTAVSPQAVLSTSGVPMFSAVVTVEHLAPSIMTLLRVGMRAKVEVDAVHPLCFVIPMEAIFEKNGLALVEVFDKQHQRTVSTAIEIGKTNLNSVIVTNGLKAGDIIVYYR